jgi:hypothetical protein
MSERRSKRRVPLDVAVAKVRYLGGTPLDRELRIAQDDLTQLKLSRDRQEGIHMRALEQHTAAMEKLDRRLAEAEARLRRAYNAKAREMMDTMSADQEEP